MLTRRPGLRFRLVALVMGVFTLVFAVIGVGGYFLVQRLLVHVVGESVHQRIAATLNLRVQGSDAYATFDESLVGVMAAVLHTQTDSEATFLLLDQSGQPALSTAQPPDQGLPAVKLSGIDYQAALAEGKEATFVLRPAELGRQHVLVHLMPLSSPDGRTIALAQGTTSLDQTDTLMRQLFWLLAGTYLVALFVVALSFSVALHRVFRPLRSMADIAWAISQGDLGKRVKVPAGGDEVERLGLAFNRMADELERAFGKETERRRQMKRFLADVAHELRSPLTSIRGFTDLAMMGAVKDEATSREALKAMRQELDRLSRLTSDLLVLERLDAGIGVVFREMDLAETVRRACDAAKLSAGDRIITTDLPDAYQWYGDRDRITQVIVNLISNSTRHTAPNGHIHVSLRLEDDECVLSCADDGEGIAPEHLPNMFQRFYRTDTARSRDTGGTGLGLAIVKAIAEGHGGTAKVESTLGKGTTVTLTLPRRQKASLVSGAPGEPLAETPALSR